MSNLRPKKLSDLVGQDDVKNCLNVAIKSAGKRSDVIDHTLFLGPAGTGKTTLALATANEVNSKIYLANGGNIKNVKDVLPYLSRLKPGDILFIDEIHRINSRVQESLFTVMEDFRLDIAKGATSISFKPFTLIGATTEAGMLLRPFFDRFSHKFMLSQYSLAELADIVKMNTKKLNISIDDDGIKSIARRSKYVPRLANSLLSWVRDYATASDIKQINKDVVDRAMKLKKIGINGLDSNDRRYIMALRGAKKPLGLSTLVGLTGMSRETIENQIEPYLLRTGAIEKTKKGRQLRG